jgi:hypothetical protein
VPGNSLNSLGLACNTAQHGRGQRTKAETAKSPLSSGFWAGALGEIRTPDPRIRSPMLYPAELQARLHFQREYYFDASDYQANSERVTRPKKPFGPGRTGPSSGEAARIRMATGMASVPISFARGRGDMPFCREVPVPKNGSISGHAPFHCFERGCDPQRHRLQATGWRHRKSVFRLNECVRQVIFALQEVCEKKRHSDMPGANGAAWSTDASSPPTCGACSCASNPARREVGRRTLTSVATFVKFELQEQIPSPRCSFNKLPIA